MWPSFSKKFEVKNINSPEYWDRYYAGKNVDMEHTLRQQEYIKFIDHRDVRVVELGCGMSAFPIIMAEKGHESWGVDYAVKTIERLRVEAPHVNWVVSDALSTPFRGGYFDVVVAGELIEHLKNPSRLVREMARLTKLNGKMILSTPHLEFEDPEHLWEFSKEDLVKLFEPWSSKVEVTEIHSQMFPGRSYLIVHALRV